MNSNPLTKFTVITAGTNGEQVAETMRSKRNVDVLFVFCRNRDYHESWAKKFQKDLGATVHTNIGGVVERLSEKPKPLPVQGFMQKEEIQKRLVECQRIAQHSQLQDLCDEMKTIDCALALREAEGGQGNAKEWAEVLEHPDPGRTMRMWSGNGFYRHLTNQLLKREKNGSFLKICRLAQIFASHHAKLAHAPENQFHGKLFRGLKIHDESVFNQFAQCKGKCVFFREFLATSRARNVAEGFATGGTYEVLLCIDCFPQAGLPPPIRIDKWSVYGNGEAEVLFPLLSGFEVNSVSVNGKRAELDVKFTFSIPDPTAAIIYAFL